MTTTLDLIERTRRHLYSGETRDERDVLADALTASAADVSLTLTYGKTSLQPGCTLAVGLEEMFVHLANDRTTATIARAEGGSAVAAHAIGDAVYINPKFSGFAILQAINEELAALSGEGLYRVATLDVLYAPGTDAYDLTGATDVLDVLDVEFDANDGSLRWATLPHSQWRLRRDLPAADFPSGMALTVNGYVAAGQTIRVAYRSGFTSLATLTDNVLTVSGLAATAHDIVPLGAAIRLTAGAEVSRNFLEQYETRRADEVGAGARNAQIRGLVLLRQQRIADEKARQYAKNPVLR